MANIFNCFISLIVTSSTLLSFFTHFDNFLHTFTICYETLEEIIKVWNKWYELRKLSKREEIVSSVEQIVKLLQKCDENHVHNATKTADILHR